MLPYGYYLVKGSLIYPLTMVLMRRSAKNSCAFSCVCPLWVNAV